jgi:23S rRNA (cytidine1920-2'-O)/16S rRNA (cytidine1409-2'-O)-methyltransferase
MGKTRVDRLVVERGLVPTREKARRLILAGDVLVDEVPVDKPGTMVREDASVRLRRPPKPYVGRGGEKLEGALDGFGLDPGGFRVLDVGASTGGFTDCVLQRGAASVTALDVGKGQLDWKLYSDPRVRVMEGVNARNLRPEDFPEPFDLALLDLSFISLSKVLPAVAPLVKPSGYVLMLVKPQFELGPEAVERGGLVRDRRSHLEALERAFAAAKAAGLAVKGARPSPITGASGNQEYFLLAVRGGDGGLEGASWERAEREACGLEDS